MIQTSPTKFTQINSLRIFYVINFSLSLHYIVLIDLVKISSPNSLTSRYEAAESQASQVDACTVDTAPASIICSFLCTARA